MSDDLKNWREVVRERWGGKDDLENAPSWATASVTTMAGLEEQAKSVGKCGLIFMIERNEKAVSGFLMRTLAVEN